MWILPEKRIGLNVVSAGIEAIICLWSSWAIQHRVSALRVSTSLMLLHFLVSLDRTTILRIYLVVQLCTFRYGWRSSSSTDGNWSRGCVRENSERGKLLTVENLYYSTLVNCTWQVTYWSVDIFRQRKWGMNTRMTCPFFKQCPLCWTGIRN